MQVGSVRMMDWGTPARAYVPVPQAAGILDRCIAWSLEHETFGVVSPGGRRCLVCRIDCYAGPDDDIKRFVGEDEWERARCPAIIRWAEGREPESASRIAAAIIMAGSFAGAIVRHVRTGGHWASRDLQRERLGLCNGCLPPEGRRHGRRCGTTEDIVSGSGCGCFIAAKVRMLSSTCPLGKW